MMRTKKKPTAIIFGKGERIWWDSMIEAKIYRAIYNAWNHIWRTGRYISSIYVS